MADEQSFQLLSFNFGARTFLYRRPGQGLSSSPSAVNSFVRENFDPVVEADRCAKHVDDIGIAAGTADELFQNIELKLQWIELVALRLFMSKSTFGLDMIENLGKTVNKIYVWRRQHWIFKEDNSQTR